MTVWRNRTKAHSGSRDNHASLWSAAFYKNTPWSFLEAPCEAGALRTDSPASQVWKPWLRK